jgi:hypothetical protein
MRDDADNCTIATHLDAYLLWLFGYMMSCVSQEEAVSRYLILHARLITDTEVH